jgi:hypothetical protein
VALHRALRESDREQLAEAGSGAMLNCVWHLIRPHTVQHCAYSQSPTPSVYSNAVHPIACTAGGGRGRRRFCAAVYIGRRAFPEPLFQLQCIGNGPAGQTRRPPTSAVRRGGELKSKKMSPPPPGTRRGQPLFCFAGICAARAKYCPA